MDEEFIRELLYQIKADNAVIQFKGVCKFHGEKQVTNI